MGAREPRRRRAAARRDLADRDALDPGPSGAEFPGVTYRATVDDYGFVLFRNGLVLALHSLACVAGFMAGSSLPQVAEGYNGVWRRIHELAGPLAIGFVALATLFSLFTQAYALGGHASTFAADLGVSPLVLVLGILPHALPELFALFLPLAAWTLASRAGAGRSCSPRPSSRRASRSRSCCSRAPSRCGSRRACCWPWRASIRRYTF